MKRYPIIDFHCDLLLYLGSSNLATAYDKEPRCSIPDLKKGGVRLQILAIYTDTVRNSSEFGRKQASIFADLPYKYRGEFELVKGDWWDTFSEKETIGILPAFENGSGFCAEEESLDAGLNRLAFIDENIGKVAYVGLTWNSENRFGGPQGTTIGLKPDGVELLKFMDGRGIAVDLSHASDALSFDILNLIDAKGLEIPILASHSNCRRIVPTPRNLPDELIEEIVRRDGVIGLNFVTKFLGSSSHSFLDQVEHLLSLGAKDSIVFGADFFYGDDPGSIFKKPALGWYFEGFDDASCYQKLCALFGKAAEAIAYQNGMRFLKQCIEIKV